MAADGQIRERVYGAIKRKLVEGEIALDQHLDIRKLSSALKASPTPIKEALVRLSGERLVSDKGKGFQVARWTAAQLRELYEWRQKLLLLAIEGSASIPLTPAMPSSTYAIRVRHVLESAGSNAGDELSYAAANADDRLSYARLVEPEIWPGVVDELEGLRVALMSGIASARVAGVRLYFARRIDGAQSIRDRAVLRSHPNGS